MGQLNEYEAPRAQVCGAFFMENMAVEVSVLTAGITQEAWGDTFTTVGTGVSSTEDIWIDL